MRDHGAGGDPGRQFDAVFPGPTQLHVYVLGLGQQGARNLPRPRGAAAPYLGPREARQLVDDPRICPAVMHGLLTLIPVRRRLERSDARRISGRTWPEEEFLQALAGQWAASAGLTGTWPQTVLRLIRCALAIRDAEGEALVAQEMLDQVRLRLKTAAADQATLPRRTDAWCKTSTMSSTGLCRIRCSSLPPPILRSRRVTPPCRSGGQGLLLSVVRLYTGHR